MPPSKKIVAAVVPVEVDPTEELRLSLRSSLDALKAVNLRRYRGETRDGVRELRTATEKLLQSI
jgi:hypothetical protein